MKLFFLIFSLGFCLLSPLFSQDRFPRPDFTTGYEYPAVDLAWGEPVFWTYLDLGLLILFLGVMAFFVFFKPNRQGVFILSLISLGYFGFFRQGCVCPIGSIQVVAQALFNPGILIPVVTLGLFLIPLVAALVGGRLFCGGVCALGALQDLVSIKQWKVPKKLGLFLGFIPPVFLLLSGAAAVTGSDYLICRWDPFVGLFRLSFSDIWGGLYSLGFLGLALVVHRPYCRFLCPYGFLQKLLSGVSFHHLQITPRGSSCMGCRLCEDSCPQGDLIKPSSPDPLSRSDQKQFWILLGVLPLALLMGWMGGEIYAGPLAHLHKDVRVLEELQSPGKTLSLEAEAYLSGSQGVDALTQKVSLVKENWKVSGRWMGVILVLILFVMILGQLRKTERKYIAPHRGNCVSCGRCQSYCPLGGKQ